MLTLLLQRPYSDREYDSRPREKHGRSSAAAVRFFDDADPDEQVHDLHQSIRDLTSDQIRMEDDLNREIDHRNRWVFIMV